MEGVLLATVSSPDNGKSGAQAIVASDRLGGFLIGWGGHLGHQRFKLRHYKAPWRTSPTDLDLRLEPKGSVMQVSPSGKFLAVGHASGDWQATLYNIEQRQLLKKIPHVRATSGVLFTPDEAVLISRSLDEIILTSVETLQEIAVIKIGLGEKIALHPSGRYLLADQRQSTLLIIDLYSREAIKALSTTAFDITTWMARAMEGNAVSGFYPNDMIVKMDFSPEGKWLLCAMQQGVRVFQWSEVIAASNTLPAPIAFASSEVVKSMGMKMAMTYDIAFDWQRNILLSCGLEGKVKSLDLATGDSKTLIELPGNLAIDQLNLSHDLTTFSTRSIYNSSHPGQRSSVVEIPGQRSSVVEIWNYLALL